MESEEQRMQQMQQRRAYSPPGTGEKVGIITGGFIGAVLLILIIFLIITKVRRKRWGLDFWNA